jgi:RimJ/RimL family protein N-acetyltransferase
VALTLPIATDRLQLRRFREDDRARFLEYRQDAETARYQGWPMPYTEVLVDEFLAEMTTADVWREGEWFQIAIDRGGVLVGDVGMCPAPDSIQLGWTLHPDSRGQGFATEAVSAVVAAAGVEAIALVVVDNAGSQRVAERVGFERDEALVDGEIRYRHPTRAR